MANTTINFTVNDIQTARESYVAEKKSAPSGFVFNSETKELEYNGNPKARWAYNDSMNAIMQKYPNLIERKMDDLPYTASKDILKKDGTVKYHKGERVVTKKVQYFATTRCSNKTAESLCKAINEWHLQQKEANKK